MSPPVGHFQIVFFLLLICFPNLTAQNRHPLGPQILEHLDAAWPALYDTGLHGTEGAKEVTLKSRHFKHSGLFVCHLKRGSVQKYKQHGTERQASPRVTKSGAGVLPVCPGRVTGPESQLLHVPNGDGRDAELPQG